VTEFSEERAALVDSLIRKGYVRSPEVADAMRKVPREAFVPDRIREDAYIDSPLPIGSGQTISAPHMVAIMVEASDLRPGHKVLEIGAGSGYHAAVVAELVTPGGHVYTVERHADLAEFARRNIEGAGYGSAVTVICGDGSRGMPEHAPYDRIFVACGAPDIPRPLLEQVSDGGSVLVPVGGRFYQDLVKLERKGDKFTRRSLGGCVFVPLVGEFGYPLD
jgi:protein-L-isoaspartate(D-aspartate) O-methyltransferase